MTDKPKNTHNHVDDACSTCGSFVDIGTVIDAQDTELVINLKGPQALAHASLLSDKAQARFKTTTASMKTTSEGVILRLNFEFTVEKMIFQLEEQL